jgi:hypothetical protein
MKFCFSCNREIEYLSEVSDPDSPFFDELCCPYCESVNVLQDNPELQKRYRTLVRVVEVGEGTFAAVIPGWHPHRVVNLPSEILPAKLRNLNQGDRLFAEVNLGADAAGELFFNNFEVAEQPTEDEGITCDICGDPLEPFEDNPCHYCCADELPEYYDWENDPLDLANDYGY